MLSFTNAASVQQPLQQQQQGQQISQEHQNIHQQMTQHQQQAQPTIQTMRLRENPPTITPPTRTSRKRKSPPSNNTQDGSQQPPPPQAPQPNAVQHVMTHTLIHAPPHMQGGPPQLPPGYAYAPPDYTTGGVAPHPNQLAPQPESPPDRGSQNQGRALSSSKRAEQNRKAQRAFRERRDQHVKALESRSQLLDTALASADEANRRWEECRTLVDQLRIENAALRAALSQAQMLPHGGGVGSNGHLDDGPKADEGDGGPDSKE